MTDGVTQVEWKTSLYNEEQKSSGKNDLDKDAFLNILVTQLQNQDPLDPMEDREFIAQMAQFSSLEQMQNLNETASANHQEMMEHLNHMNNNMMNSYTTMATQLNKLTNVFETYLKTSIEPIEVENASANDSTEIEAGTAIADEIDDERTAE